MNIKTCSVELSYYSLIIITGIEKDFGYPVLYVDKNSKLILRLKNSKENSEELLWVYPLKVKEMDFKIVCVDYDDKEFRPDYLSTFNFSYELTKKKDFELSKKTIILETVTFDRFKDKHRCLEERVRELYCIEFDAVFDKFFPELMRYLISHYGRQVLVKAWNAIIDLHKDDTFNRDKRMNYMTGWIIREVKTYETD